MGRIERPAGAGPATVAVIGGGISGLSAAWLLSQIFDVTLFEEQKRIGGHANTVQAGVPEGSIPIDTGFIVYNPINYPNLTSLFAHMDVESIETDMSFSVSLDGGALEYGGAGLDSLFAQRRNLLKPSFWLMLRDVMRFYRTAGDNIRKTHSFDLTIGEFLAQQSYGHSFTHNHLLPMAAAIWSASSEELSGYPAAAFIRFFENHGLMQIKNRPPWCTVRGGSIRYVERLLGKTRGQIRVGCPVRSISRSPSGVLVAADGATNRFDRVLVATHADRALSLLSDATEDEKRLLGAFRYTSNTAVLHSDPHLMPRRRKVWSSWNYLSGLAKNERKVEVTYWMNKLQALGTAQQFFVTLNPSRPPNPETVTAIEKYDHPLFDTKALHAQNQLACLQGQANTWFAGSYFGSGFHEDGLKSGLDAAESMGSPLRPWHASIASNPRLGSVRDIAQ